ncbi:hypothetical protein AUJ46_03925 [Candidatus Peregrinibacteria bacterium CG1_02_54_53]|nr:MAG: hypothetical protein AUJ46_03925 [Candidatus Peregrinibacteria bacterium CG1_02_54_53]
MFTLLSHQSLIIMLLSFVGSFFATNTGGVGLIMIPVLILFGLTPQQSAATFRLGVTLGDFLSLHRLERAGKVDRTMTVPVLLLGIAGGVIGSIVLIWTPGPLAEKLFSIFILSMVIVTLLKPNLGLQSQRHQSRRRRAVGYASIFFFSILSTYFSAATGLLGRSALMLCFGQTFLESSATRKVQSLGMGMTATIIFVLSGSVHWIAAVSLVPAMTLGSLLGSAYAIRRGDRFVRSIFFVVVCATAFILLLR